jgi:hypothetical protein
MVNESDRLYRLARIVALANRYLGDDDLAISDGANGPALGATSMSTA